MKIPDHVTIGPYVYRVVPKGDIYSEDGRKLFGCIDYVLHEIQLWDGCDASRVPVTFWHEILHGLSDMTQSDLKEKQVGRMAPALMAFLSDNNLLKEDS